MGPCPSRTVLPAASLAACELNSAQGTQGPEPMLVRPCVFAEAGFFFFFCSSSQQWWVWLFLHFLSRSGLAWELNASESPGVAGARQRGFQSQSWISHIEPFGFAVCSVKLCADGWWCGCVYIQMCMRICVRVGTCGWPFAYAHVCARHRLMLNVFLRCSLPNLLRRVLALEPRTCQLVQSS